MVDFIDIVDLATFDPDKLLQRLRKVAPSVESGVTDCKIMNGEFEKILKVCFGYANAARCGVRYRRDQKCIWLLSPPPPSTASTTLADSSAPPWTASRRDRSPSLPPGVDLMRINLHQVRRESLMNRAWMLAAFGGREKDGVIVTSFTKKKFRLVTERLRQAYKNYRIYPDLEKRIVRVRLPRDQLPPKAVTRAPPPAKSRPSRPAAPASLRITRRVGAVLVPAAQHVQTVPLPAKRVAPMWAPSLRAPTGAPRPHSPQSTRPSADLAAQGRAAGRVQIAPATTRRDSSPGVPAPSTPPSLERRGTASAASRAPVSCLPESDGDVSDSEAVGQVLSALGTLMRRRHKRSKSS